MNAKLNPVDAGKAAVESKPRRKFEHFKGNRGGKLKRTSTPKPKDWSFRTKSEGRASLIMPKKKPIKTVLQLWTHKALLDLLVRNKINMGNGEGNCRWFIAFDEPARKMTAQDQIDIMIADSNRMFEVKVNLAKKYFIIVNKEGELE